MGQHEAQESLWKRLEEIDYGQHGLTRHELRAAWPALPDVVYLHLPDSKRFMSGSEVVHEVRRSAGRAEGEFMAADDDTLSTGAEADGGPAGYGDSPLVSPGAVGASANRPLPGFDGNSLETEQSF